MLKRANIYNNRICLSFEEIHKPAVPSHFGAAGFAV